MKIWVIGRNYPTKKNKMCGSFELEQAKLLALNGHEVTYIVCPFHPLYKVKKWGATDWQEGRVHVFAYSQLYFPQRFNIYWDSFKEPIWSRLLERVEAHGGVPDVIHLHYPAMISVPSPILEYKNKGSKIVATEHWSNVLTMKLTDHAKDQLKTYVEGADHFICVGEPLKKSVVRLTGTQKYVEVVPNFVPNTFDIKRVEHNGFIFVSPGRLIKTKQFDKLILSFAKAFIGCKDVSLIIVGGGNQYGKLKKLIQKTKMENQIKLTGTKTREEVAEIMASADALVSYSRLETFGVPIIEAWYSGIPAIATTAIGFKEYWNDSLGKLIPYNNDDLLVNAMKQVRENYGSYSNEIIKSFAKDHFSEEVIYNRLMELYKN